MKWLEFFISSYLLLNNVLGAQINNLVSVEQSIIEQGVVDISTTDSVPQLTQEFWNIWRKLEAKGMKMWCNGTFQSFNPQVPAIPTSTEGPRDCSKLTGTEMMAFIEIGSRVVRGADWHWGNQDGGPGSEGTVISTSSKHRGYIRVKWSNGSVDYYRMGVNGKYDLKILNCT